MESNFPRSRSYSSESRESVASAPSESRGSLYTEWLKTDHWIARGGLSSAEEMHQAYNNWLSEQTGGRTRIPVTSYWGESNGASESRDSMGYVEPPKPQYNSLRDIDDLIERLENPAIDPNVSDERLNQILYARKEKIKELRRLVEQAKKKEHEDTVISGLEAENNELDKAIEAFKRGRIK